jgi:hypothetical protein
MLRKAACCAAALALTLASPAWAAPSVQADEARIAELVRWGSCAAVIGIYEGAVSQASPRADRELLDRAHAAEPRMRAHFEAIAGQFDQTLADELMRRVAGPTMARMLKLGDAPGREARILAEFRPDLEPCIADAASLPEPTLDGQTST